MQTESEKSQRGMSLGIPEVDDARKGLTLQPKPPRAEDFTNFSVRKD